MAVLEMLNIMESLPLTDYHLSGVEAMHWKIEAQKLAYADLQRYLGDPRFGPVPVDGLISKRYGVERAKLIDGQKAACQPKRGNPLKSAGDTIYPSVVDRDGNIVSLIRAVYLSFGSVILPERNGFRYQNRGGQGVIHDSKTGVRYGAPSPRKDGAALPEPPPYFREVTRRKQ